MAAVTRDQTPTPPAMQERGSPTLRSQQPTPPAMQERGTSVSGGSTIKGGIYFGRFNQGLDTP